MGSATNLRYPLASFALASIRPLAVNQPVAGNVFCAVVAGDRCHKLKSRPGQHCSHWATEAEAAGMTSVESTSDIVTVGAQFTLLRPVQ